MPRKPRKSAPLAPVREPRPASLAIVAGLRAPKLPNYAALTLARGEPRMNSKNLGSHNSDYVQLAQILTCVTRLDSRTPHASRHGGAGVRLAARFFPIINHTPPAIFSQ